MTNQISYCAIYPGIGIARLGNSSAEFFVGPEAPGFPVHPRGGFKDRLGRVKRQASRFHIYAFDDQGQAIQEITTVEADITWTVHLANRKASWFEFVGFPQQQESEKNGDEIPLRNAVISDRETLIVDPGPRSIAGENVEGSAYRFDTGTFRGVSVPLGEVRTDELGRVMVLGGFGRSGSTRADNPIVDYANNDDWYDDTSDGPVTAKVVLKNGVELPVRETSWVIVAPPDFAPAIDNLVSWYDVAAEVAIDAGPGAVPKTISFTRDIFPLLARLAGYTWVSASAQRGHRAGPRPSPSASQGQERKGDFLAPGLLRLLADNSEAAREARLTVFRRLRNPYLSPEQAKEQANYYYMPQLSGDGGHLTLDDPSTWFSLLKSQYSRLERWAHGDFESDWNGIPASPRPLYDLPVSDQPAALSKAALEHCVGGPFFPGIEVTFIARDPSFYRGPYRLREDLLPGDMTKRMAVPWQADFYECRDVWWPAQRPDDVISEAEYKGLAPHVESRDQPDWSRGHGFTRVRWDRGVGSRIRYQGTARALVQEKHTQGDNEMVDKWTQLGFVIPVPTSRGQKIYVESERAPYDGLRDRDYFYIMMNLDAFPDFGPVAKSLADSFLAEAARLLEDPNLEEDLRYFPYTDHALEGRLQAIYNGILDRVDAYAPDSDQVFDTREAVVERIRQMAPFNQTDGAWLRNVTRTGPIDEVHALLFNVWMDEVGNGEVSLNHSNLYTELLQSIGIYNEDVTTRAYAYNPDLLESAFTVPLFELVISQFSDGFFPELLGMTLQLEWEVVESKTTIKLLEKYGINAQFYKMHVGIDNAVDGHGAKAKQAVVSYLDRVRAQSGEEAVQAQWKRIWTGYVAFETTGSLGEDLRKRLHPSKPATLEDKVAEMIRRKRSYGQLNHGVKRLGPDLINDLFDSPASLMKALVKSRKIVPGDPDTSPFFDLVRFTGPMYKVFTSGEIELWKDWTRSLGGQPPSPPPPAAIGDLMARAINTIREHQEGSSSLGARTLSGRIPSTQQRVTQPLAWWLRQPTAAFMRALADDQSSAQLVSDLLTGNDPVARALRGVAPGTAHRTWRSIVKDWINTGRPTPDEPSAARTSALRQQGPTAEPSQRLLLWSSPEEVAVHPRGRILGNGTVH